MVEMPVDSSSELTENCLSSKLLLQYVSFFTYHKLAFFKVKRILYRFTIQPGLTKYIYFFILLPWYHILAWQVFLLHSLALIGTLALHHSPVEPMTLGGEKGFTTHLPDHLLTLIGACLSSKFKSM